MKEGYHMSNKFTRNITKVKDIKKQGLDTNNPNDLISLTDNKTVYLRREKDYHCLTDNVKSIKINSTEFLADENNHVETQKLVEKVDKYTPNENGYISTDYPLSVNGQTIDNKTTRNIAIYTGVLTVNGQQPDETGNVTLETGGSNDDIFINGMKLKTGNIVTGNNIFDIPLNVITDVNVEKEIVSNGIKLTFSGELVIDFTNTPVSLVRKEGFFEGRYLYYIAYKEGLFYNKDIGLSNIPITQESFIENNENLYVSFNDLPPLIITDSIYKENVPMIMYIKDTSVNDWDKNSFIPFQFNCDVYEPTNEPS